MANLESLANLGEIIGAVAVIVSLVYLSVQVRQNTRAQQAENYARALDRIAAMQNALSQDSASAAMLSRGVLDPAELMPRERLQLTWALYELFGALEFIFLAARDNAIPQEIWDRWSMATAWWLRFDGVQTWWRARPIPFAKSFTSYVDALIEDNPAGDESMQRYLDFVAHGASRSPRE